MLNVKNVGRFYLGGFVTFHPCLHAIPLQAWTDLEGSSRLKLPDFKTIGT